MADPLPTLFPMDIEDHGPSRPSSRLSQLDAETPWLGFEQHADGARPKSALSRRAPQASFGHESGFGGGVVLERGAMASWVDADQDPPGHTLSQHGIRRGGSPAPQVKILDIPALGDTGGGSMKIRAWDADDDDDDEGVVSSRQNDLPAPATEEKPKPAHGRGFIGTVKAYALGTAPALLSATRTGSWADFFINAVPRGLSQVVFANNPLCGALIAAALAWANSVRFFCCAVSLLCATVAASIARISPAAVRGGLFGYNAVLVGLGVHVFVWKSGSWAASPGGDAPYAIALAAVLGLLCAPVSAAVANLTVPTLRIPPFTIPFNIIIISTAAAISASGAGGHFPEGTGVIAPWVSDSPNAANFFQVANLTSNSTGAALQANQLAPDPGPSLPPRAGIEDVLEGSLRGVGQIFFVGDRGPSALILGAVLISSPSLSIALYAGSLFGCAFAAFIGAPGGEVFAGLWGYNPSLTAAAVVMFFVPRIVATPLLLSAGSLLASILFPLMRAMFGTAGAPAGTAPFCAAGVLIMMFKDAAPSVVLVDLDNASTPETHWRLWREENRQAALEQDGEEDGHSKKV